MSWLLKSGMSAPCLCKPFRIKGMSEIINFVARIGGNNWLDCPAGLYRTPGDKHEKSTTV